MLNNSITTSKSKVQSSMTLFDAISPDDVFGKVLDQFYGGVRDERTLDLLGENEKW